MKRSTTSLVTILRTLGAGTAAITVIAACTSTEKPSSEPLASQAAPVWTNGSFEMGTPNNPPQSWTVTTELNPGVTVQNPQTFAGLNLTASNKARALTYTLAGTNQPDPTLGAGASLRYCRYGAQCAIVNEQGYHQNANILSQVMTVGSGDVDPADGQVHVRLVVAPVLQDPGHPAAEQPYFFVQLLDQSKGNAVLFSTFNFSNETGVPWLSVVVAGQTYRYTDWQLVDVPLGPLSQTMGDSLELQLVASGCSPGGHWGQLYVDGAGSTIPGLFVSGSAPAQANAGTDITYTLRYENGSSGAETGVVVTFATPPGTTFKSASAPAGVNCTNNAGTVTCTVTGSVAAGAGGSLGITVTINPATTGTIVAGNYGVASNQETRLLGNKLYTVVGCSADSQCLTGNWCNESQGACDPTFANNQPLPVDTKHANPTLNGMCTASAGKLVCTSGVCDTDSKCGYANGDGSCTSANTAVCRSGACDKDGKCGYAVGDGPCTPGTPSAVCRSNVCSTNGMCEPVGGCNVDADCTGGKWCDETAHACTAKEPNGTLIPNDPPHTSPTLNGSCSASAGTLVCATGVCDTVDNKCGYLNGDGSCSANAAVCRSAVCDGDGKCGYAAGDGPCTIASGPLVCRTGACSVAGKCLVAPGCLADGDCPAGQWCDEALKTCMMPLANGIGIPNDPTHVSPTLDGMCLTGVGALVCMSGVCGSNGKCGLANGQAGCTSLNGPQLCQSGACSKAGTCEPAGGCNEDADCPPGNWCDEDVNQCTAQLSNGTDLPSDTMHTSPTLDGMCLTGVGALVCLSGVCGNNGKCGLANGQTGCTPATGPSLCQSLACSKAGTCEPVGGCNEDDDCPTGQWCNEAAQTCEAPLPNGTPIPNDPMHANPTLNATCTALAATLVCASGVCDPKDNACGYANGDGMCALDAGAADGGVAVCRSGICGASGICVPPGSCSTNQDCTDPASPVCDPTSHTCVAPDAGSATDAGEAGEAGELADAAENDAEAFDAALDADAGGSGNGLEAGTDADATPSVMPQADGSDSGYVEGGGCAVGRSTSAGGSSWAGVLACAGLVAGSRRRRRR